MSKGRDKTWVDWPGLKVEPRLRFFRTQLKNGTWISHRCECENRKGMNGVAIILKHGRIARTLIRIAR